VVSWSQNLSPWGFSGRIEALALSFDAPPIGAE
jgi:hypothetical protein